MRTMNKKLVTLMVAALALLSANGQLTFTGVGPYDVIEITPEKSTGLDKIYVVYDIQGVGMTFNSSTGKPATWETFNFHDGNLVMEPVTKVRWNGMATTLDEIEPNIGYKIQDGNNHPFYCWVVNYSYYDLELNAMSCNEASCGLLSFNIDGHANAIPYYTTNGIRQVLDRKIKLQYKTLVWNGNADPPAWEKQDVEELFAALDQGVEIEPPLCDTDFSLIGDWFREQWGLEQDTVECYDYVLHAVKCNAMAMRKDLDSGEEKPLDISEPLSAPVYAVFRGYPTPAVSYRVWEMATDQDFENIILQYNQDVWEYTFNDAGTYCVRYRVANADGTCEDYSDTYTITVSESSLGDESGRLPNVFSPGSTEGVNDEWKVTYKSLAEFHCWIYNRWGNLVYEFTNPDEGWNGTYHGQLVDTGVYYYVVTATGTDGVKYKKRGDITILRYKGTQGTSNNGYGGY